MTYAENTTDAWILLAVRYAGPPLEEERSLGSIVAAADAINRAVPGAKEVDGAFRRLTSYGLVVTGGGKAVLTANARVLLERVHGGSWLEEWKRLTVEIEHLPAPPSHAASFEKREVQRAVDSYIHHAVARRRRTTR